MENLRDLLVLYGSQTGYSKNVLLYYIVTCPRTGCAKEVAEDLEQDGIRQRFRVHISAMDDFDIVDLIYLTAFSISLNLLACSFNCCYLFKHNSLLE